MNENLALLNKWSKRRKTLGYSIKTEKTYTHYLKDLAKITGKKLTQITKKDIIFYENYMRNKTPPITTRSLKSIRTAFKSFFETYLNKYDVLPKDRIRMKKGFSPNTKALTGKQLLNIFKHTPNIQVKAIFGLGYYAGLRVSEVCNLKEKDLDFLEKKIIITQGKGNKDAEIRMFKPLEEILKKYLKSSYFLGKKALFEFHSKKGLIPFYEKKIERIVLEVFTNAGVMNKTGFHTFRHSIATHLIYLGWNLNDIKNHLRHSNIATTSTYLTGVTPKNMKEYIENIKKLGVPLEN